MFYGQWSSWGARGSTGRSPWNEGRPPGCRREPPHAQATDRRAGLGAGRRMDTWVVRAGVWKRKVPAGERGQQLGARVEARWLHRRGDSGRGGGTRPLEVTCTGKGTGPGGREPSQVRDPGECELSHGTPGQKAGREARAGSRAPCESESGVQGPPPGPLNMAPQARTRMAGGGGRVRRSALGSGKVPWGGQVTGANTVPSGR